MKLNGISDRIVDLTSLLMPTIKTVMAKIKVIYEANHNPLTDKYVGVVIPMVDNPAYSLSGIIYSDEDNFVHYDFIFTADGVADLVTQMAHAAGEAVLIENLTGTHKEQPIKINDVVAMQLAYAELLTIMSAMAVFPATQFVHPK